MESLKIMPIKERLSEVDDEILAPIVAYALSTSWTEADGSLHHEDPRYVKFRQHFGSVYPKGSNFMVVVEGFVFVVCPAPGYDAGAEYELDVAGGSFELRRVGE